MPIQPALRQVADQPTMLAASKLVSEQQLEEMIVREPRILSSKWMLIGRQEITTHGGRIDFLAIAPDGANMGNHALITSALWANRIS